MKNPERYATIFLNRLLKPAFGVSLLLSQFLSGRTACFSDSTWMLAVGGLLEAGSLALLILASRYLKEATTRKAIADSGPYRYIRHPIYISVYILCAGLGLLFFSWVWFLVMAAFLPAWYLVARKEEKEMIAVHGERYREYMRRTRMVPPGLL